MITLILIERHLIVFFFYYNRLYWDVSRVGLGTYFNYAKRQESRKKLTLYGLALYHSFKECIPVQNYLLLALEGKNYQHKLLACLR